MTTPADYHFHIGQKWNGRVTVEQGNNSSIMVKDRDTAIQGIRDLLNHCVPSLVLNGHEYPNERTLHVTVSDKLDFTIDAADVLAEPIHYSEPDVLV